MKTPLTWFGGKFYMLNHLLSRIPEHHTYCEVFGGSAALLFAKPLSKVEVYNDLDSGLVNFFKLLQDPEDFKLFEHKMKMTPYSRELFNEYRKTWDKQDNRVDSVHQWYAVILQSFSGCFGSSWRPTIIKNNASVMTRHADTLDKVVQRVRNVHVEHNDWRKILDTYDTENTFFYLDPPYVHDTRSSGKRYSHEMKNEEHESLIENILNLKGKILMSGYANSIYDDRLKEWTRQEFKQPLWSTRSKAREGDSKDYRIEVLWYNYDVQMKLF